jgi:hypothetical protein
VPLAEPGEGLAAAAPAKPAPAASIAGLDASPESLRHVPPHQLWASLEDAFAAPEDTADTADTATDKRLPGYIGLAITLALSFGLWAIIVKLFLLR